MRVGDLHGNWSPIGSDLENAHTQTNTISGRILKGQSFTGKEVGSSCWLYGRHAMRVEVC